MARFYGKIGYKEDAVETSPGVWENVIVEKEYYGDVLRNSRQLREGDKVNDDITVSNSISIVADAYANDHFSTIQYVRWSEQFWKVDDVTAERPRLILRLGGVYNGPRAQASTNA